MATDTAGNTTDYSESSTQNHPPCEPNPFTSRQDTVDPGAAQSPHEHMHDNPSFNLPALVALLTAAQAKKDHAFDKMMLEQDNATASGQIRTEKMEILEVEWMKACDEVEHVERVLVEFKVRQAK